MFVARLDRWTACALALLLAALTAYGLFSLPQIAAHWGVSAWGVVVLFAWAATAGWALATVRRRLTYSEWLGFALVALVWRVATLMLADGRVSSGDSHWYLVLAEHLREGQGLVLYAPHMRLAVRALYPPLYPLLLAGWTGVHGESGWSLLALSTLLDLGTAWLIVRVGGRLAIARAGLAAALLYLIWPSTLFNAPLAQKESLELLLVMAVALGWVKASRGDWRRSRLWIAIGVPAGLLTLTQPGLAMLPALFGLALAPRLGIRRLVAIGAPAAGFAVLMMLPWWGRNWLLFHRFVPLTSAAGLSLWVGNNSGATGNWMPYPPELHAANEFDYAKAAGRLAIEWMRAHPLEAARLTLAKFVRAIGLGESGVVRLAGMQPPLVPGTTAALFLTEHVANLAMLSAGAAALAWRRGAAVLTALLAAGVAQLLLFGVWFEFGERHREFLTPLLLLVIAAAAASIRRRTAPAAVPSARPAALDRRGRRARPDASPRRR